MGATPAWITIAVDEDDANEPHVALTVYEADDLFSDLAKAHNLILAARRDADKAAELDNLGICCGKEIHDLPTMLALAEKTIDRLFCYDTREKRHG